MEAASRRDFLVAGAAATVPTISTAASGKKPAPATRAGLLAGKVAVIYGAAGAMGSAVARAFAREGAHVELAGRTLEKVQALATEIARAGDSAAAAKVDALDEDSIAKHLDAVIGSHGRVDVSFNLISLAGPQGDSLAGMSVEDVVAPVEGAVRTHFLTATAAARHMARRHSGVILALTAQVARKPYTGSGGFGVACAAIEGLCRQLAVDLGGDGIRVVALRSSGSPDAPGVAFAIGEHARLAGVTREAFEARIAEKTMLKRMPKMAEVANAAVLMASDRAGAITAAVTNVTCGEIAD
ncbi:MAG TPA: SDR family oxidoreductase [Steroidobacteraceae bacterium]|nr:SDR family oxidoreductase [Steroidobacteraceae bacterium]